MRILLVILCGLIFSSCTVRVNFYLKNGSDKTVKVRAHLHNEKVESLNLKYKEELSDISFDLVADFSKELQPSKVEGSYLYFNLPPMSTFFIGTGANFKNFTFDEIEIKAEEKDDVILNWDNQNLLERGKNFGKRYYAWYTIN